MRTRLLIASLAVALVAAPSSVAASGNPQIAGLQVALRAQGLYHGAIDAVAGTHTVAAVRRFQRIHGLPVTGLVDAQMRRDLGPLGRPLFGARTIRRGDFGWDVAVLQFLLVRKGISAPINAYFDGPTVRGVRLLQRRLHLAPDGIVGAGTLHAIARRESVPLARSRTQTTPRHVKPVSRHVKTVSRHVEAKHRYGIHVVRAGDTLSALASRYGTTVAKLARLNHLDPSHYLLVGTRLRVPVAAHRAAARRTPARTMSIPAVQALLDRWATHYGVGRHLVRALAWMESGYNNRAVSSTGARGIMQIEPYTWRFVESVLIGHHVRHGASGNVHVGVAYLHHLLGDFHGDTRHALAGWYQGERAVRRHGMYQDTRVFVRDVLALSHRM
jgi:LysM repeat protein